MKKKTAQYAKAFLSTLEGVEEGDVASRLNSFISFLKEKESNSFVSSVLKALSKELEKIEETRVCTITTHHASHLDGLKDQMELAKNLLNAGSAPITYRIDNSLVGGFVMSYNGTTYNASHKKTLINLYSSLTA